MRNLVLAAIAALTLSGAAQASGDESGRNVCLRATDIDHTHAISDNVLLVYMRGGKIWRNDLHTACPGLKFEDAIAWDIRGGTVCANLQTFRVLRRGNTCFLGGFTPYVPPEKHAGN